MKTVKILLLTVLLLFAMALPAFAESSPVYVLDGAQQLSPSQEAELETLLKAVQEETGIFVAVSFGASYSQGLSVESLAKNQFRAMGGGENGAIFYVDMVTREWSMQGIGEMEEILSSDAVDYLEEECISLLKEGRYAQSALAFGRTIKEILVLYRNGTPYTTPFPLVRYIVYALGIGLFLAAIVVFGMAAQLKSVSRKNEARDYLKKDSLKITRCGDLFLYRTVVRIPRAQNTSSGGRSSGGGGRSGRF